MTIQICQVNSTPSTLTLTTSSSHPSAPLSSTRSIGENTWAVESMQLLDVIGELKDEGWSCLSSCAGPDGCKTFYMSKGEPSSPPEREGDDEVVFVKPPKAPSRRRSSIRLGGDVPKAEEIVARKLSVTGSNPILPTTDEKVEWAPGTVMVDNTPPTTATPSSAKPDAEETDESNGAPHDPSMSKEKREEAFFASMKQNEKARLQEEAKNLSQMTMLEREKYEKELMEKNKHSQQKSKHMQRLSMTYRGGAATGGGRGRGRGRGKGRGK
ncbi:hypothetical protein TrST_g2458 [Triparma strigata]|uniref:Uncharacterized protein n=1 Tax=Triparma strigata TaxID=1606541 RepID=A0A9W7BT19_9STRA|nr:hypothetical protein TrST_g2458 [Triparma strigata]